MQCITRIRIADKVSIDTSFKLFLISFKNSSEISNLSIHFVFLLLFKMRIDDILTKTETVINFVFIKFSDIFQLCGKIVSRDFGYTVHFAI